MQDFLGCVSLFGDTQPSAPSQTLLPRSFCRNYRYAFSHQARDGHGGTPLHKAAGTANFKGVEKLIAMRADVNATNERGQAPVDMVRESNWIVRWAIEGAGGRQSPTWNGVSGRMRDPCTRKQHQGASASRQQRAQTWRESQSGSQPGSSSWQPGSSSSQPGKGGKGAKGSGSQPGKGGKGAKGSGSSGSQPGAW